MKKHFIHHPLFRLLSPLFIGSVVYLLILLINNNVEQLQAYFLGEELYFCIGLSYLIQETARLLLILSDRFKTPFSFTVKTLIKVCFLIFFSIGIVSTAIHFYYKYFLGFEANFSELVIFNSIYIGVTLLYTSLYLSHQFLYKENTKKLTEELIKKKGIEERFRHFKRGINPQLLFESLESLLILMQKDKEKSDDFIDDLSTVYRYILSEKNRELVPFQEEIKSLQSLLSLFNNLPYRKIELLNILETKTLLIPGSLLSIVEQIIRSTIIDEQVYLKIRMEENEKMFFLVYESNEKLTTSFNAENLAEVKKSYATYTNENISLETTKKLKRVGIPKLFHSMEHHNDNKI